MVAEHPIAKQFRFLSVCLSPSAYGATTFSNGDSVLIILSKLSHVSKPYLQTPELDYFHLISIWE